MRITHTTLPDGIYKCGTLKGVSRAKLVSVLGEPTEGESGDGKSKCRWHLSVEIDGDSYAIAIWDWRFSGDQGEWSYYGPIDIINKVLS